ncbi:MAG: methionine adenosyltransferase, partial [Fibrella sp.]|nr:methionine adenosyltransferase [Armatimonadota bacterium]
MATTHQLFTSESVTEGHPDKLADAISDAILDACLGPSKHNNGTGDPRSRVAIETLLTRGLAVIAGELTTETYVEIADVVRETILEVGYDSTDIGFDGRTTGVTIAVQKQSPDISAGVDTGGAGDQGMMFGFACDDTPELMPLPITIAHRLTKIQAQLRRDNPELGLRPDAKSQVTIAYNADGTPSHIDTLVLSTQHSPNLTL